MKFKENIDFHELLVKFFAREITDDEMILFKSWLESSPENRKIFDRTNELWQGTDISIINKVNETDTAWADLSTRLGIARTKKGLFQSPGRYNLIFFIAAASIAFILVVGGITKWNGNKSVSQRIAVAFTRVATTGKEKAHIFLSDSTEVILNSNSSFQYNDSYNQENRQVKLTGEAFFSVHTNPAKPFVVETKGMKVTATGTRFNICSYENDDRVETTLEEGKIQVVIGEKEPLNLKSGQQVVYYKKSDNLLVHYVPLDTYSSWKDDRLKFIETPLEDVLRKISRKYDVEFQISNPQLYTLNYTATFLDEPVDEIMKMLASVSPITYKIMKPASKDDKNPIKSIIVVGRKKRSS